MNSANWKEDIFDNFIKLNRGFDLPDHSVVPGEFPVVASSSIKTYHKEFKVKGPGVVTGRSGSLGAVQFIDGRYWPLNTTLYVKDFKGNNPRYVYYFLQLIHLENFNAGSGVPTLNQNHLHKIKIKIPPLQEQKKIAAVLSAYDDLIKNNKRRIALLERMAEEIYSEWFMRMRFPGHKNTKFVKGVPTTWKIRELKSLVEDIIDYRGLTPEKLGGHWAEEGIIALSALNVKAGELIRLDDSKRASEVLYERWMRKRLQAHDILLTSEAPLGQVYFLVDSEQYVLSQRLFAIRANPAEVTTLYLYQYLRYPIGQGQLQARATGSTVGGIRQTLLKRVEVIVPTDTLMKKHQECVLPINNEIHALWKQNHVLTQTRDRLLPRLISGKLSVGNLDIQFPPSMQDEATS